MTSKPHAAAKRAAEKVRQEAFWKHHYFPSDALLSELITDEYEPLVEAVRGLSRAMPDGSPCWCWRALGNPMYSRHSTRCEALRAALARIEGEDDDR